MEIVGGGSGDRGGRGGSNGLLGDIDDMFVHPDFKQEADPRISENDRRDNTPLHEADDGDAFGILEPSYDDMF